MSLWAFQPIPAAGALLAAPPQSLSLPTITDGDTLSVPEVRLAQMVAPPALTSTTTLYTPTLVPGPVSITGATITDGDSVYGQDRVRNQGAGFIGVAALPPGPAP